MTERKRMIVTFSDEEWEKVLLMKQKFYDESFSKVIRRAVEKGYDAMMAEETRKADATG